MTHRSASRAFLSTCKAAKTKRADLKRKRNRFEFMLRQIPPIREAVEDISQVAGDDAELADAAHDCAAAIRRLQTDAQTLLEVLQQRVLERGEA